MRIALAQAALAKPNLLLLDEPNNHLDPRNPNWLEGYLRTIHCYILISHDRYFLDITIDRTVEIWNKRSPFYQGNYTEISEAKRRAPRATGGRVAQSARAHPSILRPSLIGSGTRPPRPKQVRPRIKESKKSSAFNSEAEPVISLSSSQPPPSGRTVAEAENLRKD